MVVKLKIGDSDVKRVLIDQGSCSKIMYPDLFHGLGFKQSDLQPYDAPLVGFSGESIRTMGRITMAVHMGPISLETEFLVLNVPSPYPSTSLSLLFNFFTFLSPKSYQWSRLLLSVSLSLYVLLSLSLFLYVLLSLPLFIRTPLTFSL